MNLGKVAYEAYIAHTGGKSLAFWNTLPPWEDLPNTIKEAWQVSASAVGESIANKTLESMADSVEAVAKQDSVHWSTLVFGYESQQEGVSNL